MALPIILVADDDQDDCDLIREALDEVGCQNPVRFVHDGATLLDTLKVEKLQSAGRDGPPCLLFLDLNMPRIDGRQALKEIRAQPHLRSLPVVVFSTSRSAEDIDNSYAAGANSFISKPSSYKELVQMARAIRSYWFQTVALPHQSDR